MVTNCVAFNCNNLQDKRNTISFHSFPFKRPKILELWVRAIRRENWFPSKYSRLCSAHFLQTDYLDKPGCTAKVLKPDAVPSLFSFPKHLMKNPPLPRRKIIKHELPESPIPLDIKPCIPVDIKPFIPGDIEPPIPVDIKPFISADMESSIPVDIKPPIPLHMAPPFPVDIAPISMVSVSTAMDTELPLTSMESTCKFVDSETQTQRTSDDKVRLLRRVVKTLRQKIRRQDKRISIMKDVIRELKNGRHSNHCRLEL